MANNYDIRRMALLESARQQDYVPAGKHAGGKDDRHRHRHVHRAELEEGDVEEIVAREGWKIGTGEDATAVDVFVLDTDYNMTHQLQFWLTIIELCMAVAFAVTGAFAVSDTITINTYVFVIVGSIMSVVVVVFVHICAIVKMWARASDMSHDHMFTVTLPVFTGIFFLAIGFLVLGKWVSDYCTCCETANCQADPMDFTSVAKYHVAWTIFVVTNVVWSYTIVRALFAHIYPELMVPTTANPSKTTFPLAFRQLQEQADLDRPLIMSTAARMANGRSDRSRI